MTESCQVVQELLAEVGGDLERAEAAVQRHLGGCQVCRDAAAEERRLHNLLAAAVPPSDPELERRVLASLRPHRWTRRAVGLLPVAASLAMVVAGALLVGGVPGGGIIAFFPRWTADGWMAVGAAVSDWSLAVAASAKAVVATADPGLAVAAGMLGLAGLAGVTVTAWRLRKASSWRHER